MRGCSFDFEFVLGGGVGVTEKWCRNVDAKSSWPFTLASPICRVAFIFKLRCFLFVKKTNKPKTPHFYIIHYNKKALHYISFIVPHLSILNHTCHCMCDYCIPFGIYCMIESNNNIFISERAFFLFRNKHICIC